MLRCDGTQDQPSSLLPKAYRNDCNIVSNGMIAAGSPSSSINSSSALVIKSVDGSAPGSPLTYGQAFAITTLDGSVCSFIKLLLFNQFLLNFNFFILR